MMTEEQKQSVRLPISPVGEKYVDQFWSGMYGTLCSFGHSEQRLIWMRYSAFLVVHGLVFSFVKDCATKPDDHAETLLLTGLIGLVVCCVWAFLNYCGWKNQNMFFWYAWRLEFNKVDHMKLPTDFFGGSKPPEPHGSIFWAAQLLPVAFGFVDCLCIYPSTARLGFGGEAVRWVSAVLIGVGSLASVVFCCRRVRRRDIV
jgi:hypothetical protein